MILNKRVESRTFSKYGFFLEGTLEKETYGQMKSDIEINETDNVININLV